MHEANKRDAAMMWVKTYLSGAYARCIKDLMGCAQFTHDEVLAALRALVASSEIEALEPVGTSCGKARDFAFHPDTHFRVVRHTDTAYRWQVRIAEGVEPNIAWGRTSFIAKIDDRQYDDGHWLRMRVPVHA